jgi:glycosyltransferase involved in cell wall biosynthesis
VTAAPARLSVVVPCYQAARTLGELLESLGRQTYPGWWEIVLADNGSTDDWRAIAEAYRPRLPALTVIDASRRRGAAAARNAGARAARGDALAFIDADDVADERWVESLAGALGKHDFVASRLDATRLNPPWLRFCRIVSQAEGLEPLWYPPYLPHAGGSGLGVRRELHEAVGGFDETLPVLEDTDYCLRLQLLGKELSFVGDAVVYVRHRTTLGGLYRQGRVWAAHNVALYRRYAPPGTHEPWRWRRHAREWGRLLGRVGRLHRPEERAAAAWKLGWLVGQLQGSARYRVPPV